MKPTPILVRSFGRSGTTLAMQLLGTSKNVLFERHYPFEARLLSYVVRLAQMASMPPENGPDWSQNSVLRAGLLRAGPVPYVRSGLESLERFREQLTRSGIEAVVSSLDRSSADSDKPVYYAEKVVLDLALAVNQAVPSTKNLYLLRDPRDEFLSIKAFNKKRGTLAFGWRKEDTDDSFARRFVQARRQFMRQYVCLVDSERVRRARYEDIMLDGNGFVSAMSKWLGLELSWSEVEGDRSNFQHHMTASSGEHSVQRWKREMDSSLIDLFSEELGEELAAAEYELL